ncbi:MAG: glycosyltransferase family 4 protein [bacterium]
MKTVACTFLAAAVLALGLTPLVAWLARRLRLVDRPGVRKVHASAIPRIGGLAVALAMLAPVVAVMTLDNVVGEAFRDIQAKVIAILAGAGFVLLVGLADDVHGLRARTKFTAQLLAAAAVCAVGVRIHILSGGGILWLHLGWLSWPLTILWIAGITNAVNLIDGLDGLCAGICAAACAVIAAFALHTGQPVMAVLMAALLGSLVGFLYFNFNPARIFMGDGGTYFLGFLLAAASVLCAAKATTLVGLALPALALGVPIFDTLFSILRRFLERRSIFSPDRSHIHHLLVDMGLRQRHVVIVLYVVTALAAGMGLFLMVTRDIGRLVVFGCVLLLLTLVFRLVGSVSLHRTIAALQRKVAFARQAIEQQREFEDAELRLREARTFDQWWHAVCAAAEELDFARLSLAVTDRDGTVRTLDWRDPDLAAGPHETLSATVPVRDRRAGGSLDARADAAINGSLESAGRRLAYFGRLLDEHSLATLPRRRHRRRHRSS